MNNLNYFYEKSIDIIMSYGPKLIGAVVVLIVGFWIVKTISKSFGKLLEKRKIDASLKPFIISLTEITLKLLVLISVLGMIGVEMTSFIAILGAAGLAIGMALSGTLQNFAGGVMILIFKPFKVGNYIEAQGYAGVVKEIQIFNTILTTVDNKTIIIPNGGLSTGSLTNYSTQPKRRVDFTFGIGYGDDLNKAKDLIKEIVNDDKSVLDDPAPFVRLGELADSSVNITVRLWVKGENYWDVYFDTLEAVYESFNKNGINIPYPQLDVHIQNQ